MDDDRGVGEPLNETDWDGQGMRQWIKHVLVLDHFGVMPGSYRQI